MKKIILLHGAFGTHHDLAGLATKLPYQVINMELPFHGKDYQAFNYQSLQQALLKKLESETDYTIFGYSLGGYLALDLASKNKIQPQKIITYGTKFHWTQEIVQGISKKMDMERLKSKAPQYVADLAEKHGPNFEHFITDSIHLMQEVSERPLNATDFANINCEVKLIVGDQDSLVSVDETKMVGNQLRQAEIQIIAGGLHTPLPLDFIHIEI